MIKVFLDANILYSNTSRSLFVWLHVNGIIEIYWSYDVWQEVFEAFRKNQPTEHNRIRKSLTERLISGYPECLVSTSKFQAMGLKDSKDEHVLAYASACGADYIVTNDNILVNDSNAIGSWLLMTADHFLVKVLVPVSPLGLIQAACDHIAHSPISRPTTDRYILSLRKAQLVEFADWLHVQRNLGNLFKEIWGL